MIVGAAMPGDTRYSEPRKIVVGVTNDRDARIALRWALRTATRDDALVVAVTAYEPPRPVLTMYGWVYVDSRDAEAAARFVQQNVLQGVLGRAGEATPRVRSAVVLGDPVSVLVDAARDADLLVVGRRTRRLRHRLVRSVSKRCADSAECPVMIVRSDTARTPLRRLAPALGGVEHHPRHRERRHAQIELRRQER